MNVVRVKFVPEFRNQDVVLLAGDAEGFATFSAAVADALQVGSSRMHRRGRLHDFVIEDGAGHVELGADRAGGGLDRSKADEIAAKLQVLIDAGRPCHHYVDDMISPAPTLVLSRDEYL